MYSCLLPYFRFPMRTFCSCATLVYIYLFVFFSNISCPNKNQTINTNSLMWFEWIWWYSVLGLFCFCVCLKKNCVRSCKSWKFPPFIRIVFSPFVSSNNHFILLPYTLVHYIYTKKNRYPFAMEQPNDEHNDGYIRMPNAQPKWITHRIKHTHTHEPHTENAQATEMEKIVLCIYAFKMVFMLVLPVVFVPILLFKPFPFERSVWMCAFVYVFSLLLLLLVVIFITQRHSMHVLSVADSFSMLRFPCHSLHIDVSVYCCVVLYFVYSAPIFLPGITKWFRVRILCECFSIHRTIGYIYIYIFKYMWVCVWVFVFDTQMRAFSPHRRMQPIKALTDELVYSGFFHFPTSLPHNFPKHCVRMYGCVLSLFTLNCILIVFNRTLTNTFTYTHIRAHSQTAINNWNENAPEWNS